MNRYMEYLSKEELEQRAIDIFSNLMILSSDGKISLRKIDNYGLYWMDLWTELLEEFLIRYGDFPNGFESNFLKEAKIVKSDIDNKAKLAIEKIGGIKDNCLYKYSKKKYNLESLKYGKFRIAPASFYNNSSLNYAIKDDELVFDLFQHPRNVSIKVQKNNQIINPIGNLKRTYELNINYYIQCLSTSYEYRKFDDFEADSCLVIYDIEQFIKKVEQKLLEKYENFEFCFAEVEYIDPLKYNKKPLVFFSKHFKYSYQDEFRIILVPNEPKFDLEEFFIEIGSMEEYAKIVLINE